MSSLGFPHVLVSDSHSFSSFFLLPLLLRNIKHFRNGSRFLISYFNWIFVCVCIGMHRLSLNDLLMYCQAMLT